MYTVLLSFMHQGCLIKRELRAVAGDILLGVLLRNKINIPHDCGGVCHCTTCHLYIKKGEEFIEEATKREKDFMKKVALRESTSRLACQCVLLKGKGEIEVQLPKSGAYLQE